MLVSLALIRQSSHDPGAYVYRDPIVGPLGPGKLTHPKAQLNTRNRSLPITAGSLRPVYIYPNTTIRGLEANYVNRPAPSKVSGSVRPTYFLPNSTFPSNSDRFRPVFARFPKNQAANTKADDSTKIIGDGRIISERPIIVCNENEVCIVQNQQPIVSPVQRKETKGQKTRQTKGQRIIKVRVKK